MGDEGRTERRKEELHGAYSRATQGLWTITSSRLSAGVGGLKSRHSGAVDNNKLWAISLAAGLIRHPPPPSAKEPPEGLAPAHVLRA